MKKNKEGTQVAKHKDKKSFKARLSSIIMCAPVTIWSVLFVLVPVGMLLFMSFMTKGPLGKSCINLHWITTQKFLNRFM